jgi:tripartite-type tricarboxylate transporter receptor subunit TctC
MRLGRRPLLFAPLLLAAPALHAQAWPDRPIRLIVPFPPGGTTDIIGRLLAAQMGQRLGQTMIVENKAGAGGSLGTELVATSRPDGYTLLFGANGGLVVNTLIMANLGYDPFRQLQPIGLVSLVAMGLAVRADHPAQDVAQLVALAQARPGALSAGTPGIGTSNHLLLALLTATTGADITHVPYRGSGPMNADLLAGNLGFAIDQLPASLPMRREGKTRILALSTERRTPQAPDLPTIAESGFGDVVMVTHFGLSAPAGLPAALTARLAETLRAALADPAMQARLAGQGVDLASGDLATPEGYASFLRTDLERSRRAVQAAGIKPE